MNKEHRNTVIIDSDAISEEIKPAVRQQIRFNKAESEVKIVENKKTKKVAEDGKKNEIQIQAQTEVTTVFVGDTKSLPVALKEKITTSLMGITEEKLTGFLSKLVNSEEIRRKAVNVIHKETTYIARIPKKLEADMRSGLLDFMTDKKTGENLGMLVDPKHKMKGYMRIEEAAKADIASNLANIAIQQQLTYMTEVINDVRSRVISLQEGHDADLFGSIKGMHQQLLQMRDARNPDTKKQLATHAITILNDVRGKIEVAVLNELRDIDTVPDTDVAILLKIAKSKNFLSDTVEKYNRIEELFNYYVTGTQLLGYAYAFLDEPASYEDIFAPSNELIANENLQKLIAVENLYEESIGETWYKNPENYLLKIERASHSMFLENSDTIEIEITGEKLLEAIEHGRESSKENREEEVSDC